MSKTQKIQPVNLATQKFYSAPKLPQLDSIFERFIRDLRIKLSQRMGQHIFLENLRHSFITYSELINTIPNPTYMEVWKAGELKNRPFLVLVNHRLLSLLGEHVLGGQNNRRRLYIPNREITALDRTTIRWILKDFGEHLEEAFEGVSPLAPTFTRNEINPQFLAMLPPTDPVFVFSFDVEIEGNGGELSVVFPLSTLDPIKEKLKEPYLVEENATKVSDLNPDFHKEISVTLQAELPSFFATLGQISKLKPGEVLKTPIRPTQALWATIEGKPLKRLYMTNQSLSKGLFRVEEK